MDWRLSDYARARLACMLFFLGPGLAYGLLTSRMPALQMQTGATKTELGMLLLGMGAAGTLGLALAESAVARFGAKRVMMLASLAYALSLVGVALTHSPWGMGVGLAMFGLCNGLVDVAMNVQGIALERRFQRPSMSLLHGGYNIGAIMGSVSGAFFAAASMSPVINFALPLALFLLTLLWAQRHLLASAKDTAAKDSASGKSSGPAVPAFVLICGVLAMISYVCDGSVGEWGSLYLYQVKGTPESIAALVYGTFAVSALSCRLVADRLRAAWGDFIVAFLGALIALLGMVLVLASPWWQLALTGYSLLGIGLGPIVPVAFSRAGRCKGIAAERATAWVSMLAYSGLLVWPPIFGVLAQYFGMTASLSCVVGLLAVLAVGTTVLRKPAQRSGEPH